MHLLHVEDALLVHDRLMLPRLDWRALEELLPEKQVLDLIKLSVSLTHLMFGPVNLVLFLFELREFNLLWVNARCFRTAPEMALRSSTPGINFAIFRKCQGEGLRADDVSDRNRVEDHRIEVPLSWVGALAWKVKIDAFWFLLIIGQHWVAELEIIASSPGVCLVLLFDLVVLLVFMEHLQELFVVVVHSER